MALNELVIYELHPKTFAGTVDDVADQLGHIDATKYANIWSTTRSESAHLVVVTLNEHDATTSVDVTGDWHCVLDTPSVDYHHTGTDAMPAIQTHESSSSITLPANGAAIFVR